MITEIKPMKIAVATPFYDFHGWSPYIRSMIATAFIIGRHTQIDFDFWALDGDSYVWRARNNIAKKLLDSDFEWLMFIDSDEEFSPADWLRLISVQEPIVAAGYPCKNNWDFYGCIIHTDPQGIPITTDSGLIKARIAPTGFMKIHRSVFERLSTLFPDDYYIDRNSETGGPEKVMNFFGHIFDDHKPYGEDTSFCIRCERAGIPIHVFPDVTITHYGTRGVTGNYHEFLLAQPGGKNHKPEKEVSQDG